MRMRVMTQVLVGLLWAAVLLQVVGGALDMSAG